MDFTIGAYTTTRNCVSMDYPFLESIRSMLAFADEVVVLDTSDDTDATYSLLQELAKEDPRVKVIKDRSFDWNAPNHGIFDGQTKAKARDNCKSDFLWQFDVDEIVHELDAPKVRQVIEKANYLQQCPILALPVIEYWGSHGKVRMDVNPWKWRLSRNLPDITHGIPIHLRKVENGLDYACPGTDTCDYISRTTGKPEQFMGFVPQDVEQARYMVLSGQGLHLQGPYQDWFNRTIDEIPGVHHYSWFSIERKIKQYRMFWTSFWKAMYNEDRDPNWNPFFEQPWSEVTDEMIAAKAKELEEHTGGWIFHNRWDGRNTPSIEVNRDHPEVIKEWVKNHG